MALGAVANGHFDEDYSDPLSYYAQVLVEARTHAASSVQSQQPSATWPPPPSPGRHQLHHDSTGGSHHKSWATRLLSFLKRPNKKRQEAKAIPVQQDATAKVRSSSSKYKSAPLQQPGRQQRSGPLYTDGTPLTPSRRSLKPKSGPLAPFQLPDAAVSPYVPLRRSTNNTRQSSGPVYMS